MEIATGVLRPRVGDDKMEKEHDNYFRVSGLGRRVGNNEIQEKMGGYYVYFRTAFLRSLCLLNPNQPAGWLIKLCGGLCVRCMYVRANVCWHVVAYIYA